MTVSNPQQTPQPTAQGRVVVLNRDLMFGVRIANQLRSLGYAVEIVPSTAAFADRLGTAPAPVLGIIDLSTGPDWETVAALTADPTAAPILAFGPHTDVAARRAAKTAGVTRLVSNGDFHRDMVALVRRCARPTPVTDPVADAPPTP